MPQVPVHYLFSISIFFAKCLGAPSNLIISSSISIIIASLIIILIILRNAPDPTLLVLPPPLPPYVWPVHMALYGLFIVYMYT